MPELCLRETIYQWFAGQCIAWNKMYPLNWLTLGIHFKLRCWLASKQLCKMNLSWASSFGQLMQHLNNSVQKYFINPQREMNWWFAACRNHVDPKAKSQTSGWFIVTLLVTKLFTCFRLLVYQCQNQWASRSLVAHVQTAGLMSLFDCGLFAGGNSVQYL